MLDVSENKFLLLHEIFRESRSTNKIDITEFLLSYAYDDNIHLMLDVDELIYIVKHVEKGLLIPIFKYSFRNIHELQFQWTNDQESYAELFELLNLLSNINIEYVEVILGILKAYNKRGV